MFLDRPLVAREKPLLDRRQHPLDERVGAVVCAGLDDEIDVDLEVARADRDLHPVSVPAGVGERPRDGGLADAEEPEHAPSRRLRARQQRAKRVHLERVRPEPAQLRRWPRQNDDDAAGRRLEQQARRGAGQPERRRALRQRRLLRHPGREVGVVALQPLRRRARHRFDLPLQILVHAKPDARCARHHLDRPVVVRRPEAAGDEARVRFEPGTKRGLQLGRSVADDRDPRRLEAQPQRLAGEERPVQVGSLAAHELAARDDDESSRPAQPLASAVRVGVTTTRRFFRAGSATGFPRRLTRSPVECTT